MPIRGSYKTHARRTREAYGYFPKNNNKNVPRIVSDVETAGSQPCSAAIFSIEGDGDGDGDGDDDDDDDGEYC